MTDREDSEVDVYLSGAARMSVVSGDHVDDALLLAHRRKTLSADEQAAVDRHLATCAACRDLLAGLELSIDDQTRGRARAAVNQPAARSPRWIGLAAAAAVLLAIGAAATIALRTRDEASIGYSIDGPFGGVEQLRGDATKSTRFDQNGSVRLIVRPERATAERPELFVYVAHENGPLMRSNAIAPSWTEHGSAELIAPARALFDRTGRWSIVLVIGKSGAELAGLSISDARTHVAKEHLLWITESEYGGDSP